MKNSILKLLVLFALILSLCLSICSCDLSVIFPENDFSQNGDNGNAGADNNGGSNGLDNNLPGSLDGCFDYAKVPVYTGNRYAVINNNIPFFTKEEIVTESYEKYYPLDSLGRCTLAMACIGVDLMPTEDRGSISSVKPTGWVQKQYPTTVIPTRDIYNRSHLIAFQLTGENANRENLITGTPYLNQNKGMQSFENMVADYLTEYKSNHVMYRVTPVFVGDNLLASGVLMEAYSVEDNGDGICFNVFIYNVQPGIVIDYATGESRLETEEDKGNTDENTGSGEITKENATYLINISSKKYHKKDQSHNPITSNMKYTDLTKEELEAQGYTPCGTCYK